MSRLSGKTALVTGAGRGIGRGIAVRLGSEGARVAVHYLTNETAAKETVATVEAAGGSAFALRTELGVPGDAEALWAAFDQHAEGLDILVNNAGIEPGALGLEATTEAVYDEVFAVNTKAPFFIVKHGLDRLRDGGRVINISSGLSHHAGADPSYIAYSMAKGALDNLTVALAKELAPRNITVNTVAPGITETDVTAAKLFNEEMRQFAASMSALGRLGKPEDIAAAVAFLASDDGGWITGQWLDSSGGTLL
ncbi:SDR family oxidoreductase [Streptomyces sp. T-3]|nr:SDR family oxidoreductase [Streptomyces sp. T-3]